MIRTNLLLTAAAAATFSACSSPQRDVLRQDDRGNYATTSQYEGMQRNEFLLSMHAGLQDFDRRMDDLRARANELGGESLETFAECERGLSEKREEVVNQLEVVETALADAWPEERSEAVDEYEELREALSEAYDDVLGT